MLEPTFLALGLGFWEILLVVLILSLVLGPGFLTPIISRVTRKGREVVDTAGALLGSEESEWRLGMACAAGLAEQFSRVEDPEVRQQVSAVFSRVAPSSSKFRLHLIDAPFVNAFAAPGGHIVLTRPLVELCGESQAQLAFVLCHEMAHVQKKHWKSKMATELAAGVALSALSRGQLAGVARKLTDQLISSGYSRAMELEADRLAVERLARAGFDPGEGVRVLASLDGGKDQLPLGEYFSTHPSTELRLRECGEQIRKVSGAYHRRGRGD